MATSTDTAKSQQPHRDKSLISKVLGLPFTLLGILLV